MAIEIVGSIIDSTNVNKTIDFSSLSPLPGDVVVVAQETTISSDQNLTVVTAGYTKVSELYVSDTRSTNLGVSYKVLSDPADTVVAVRGPSNTSYASIIWVALLRGVDTEHPLDCAAATSGGGNGHIPNPAAIETITDGAVVLPVSGLGRYYALTGDETPPTGYTKLLSQSVAGSAGQYSCLMICWAVKSPAGVEDPGAWSNITDRHTSYDSGATVCVAFRPVVETGIRASYDQSYALLSSLRRSWRQEYIIIFGPLRLSWFQDYALLHYLRKDFFGLYGIRFGAAFVAWYSDLPVVRRRFVAAYRALPSVRRSRVLGYGDAGVVRLSVVQEYLLRAGVLRGFCARYRIAEEELRAAHVAAYRLREFDGVRRGPQLPYVLAADTTLEEGACSFYLPEIGLQLHPFHWEIDQDGGQHYISVELQLPDQAEAVQCRKHLRLVATADGDEFETVISTPVRRTVSPGATIYVVEAASPSIYLDVGPTAHYSRPVSGSYSGMASTIVAGLAATKGLAVSWRIEDWYIPPGRIEVSEQSPLAVIREIVHAKRARLQSARDGSLRVIYDIPTPVAQWRSSAPALVVIDQEHWRQAVETPEERPGYNRLSLSDLAGGAGRSWFEERRLSAVRLYQHLYQVPWVGGRQPVLQTSSVGVAMEPLGMIEEIIEGEEIAIEHGSGRTAKPIYGVVSAVWGDVDLGDIAYTEEGELTTAVAEQSLLYLSYRTRYWRWLVTNHRRERVQFYVEATV